MNKIIRKLQVGNESSDSKPKQLSLYKQILHLDGSSIEERLFEVLRTPNVRMYCHECQFEVTRHVYAIVDFGYFCVRCMAMKDELPAQYLLHTSLRISLTDSSWDCLDEVILLTGLRIWGLGNWSQIKDYMHYNGSPFSAVDIERHYQTKYLEQPEFMLKISDRIGPAKQKDTIAALNHNYFTSDKSKAAHIEKGEKKLKLDDELALRSMTSMVVIDSKENADNNRPQEQGNDDAKSAISLDDQEEPREPRQQSLRELPRSSTNNCSVMCYNPKRKEFESIEYDYQAEMMLADLEFNDNDSPEETQLKCRLVEEYSRRLKERYVRREFVVEYKLLDHYNGVKSPYEEEDLLLLPFMRFTDNQKRYSRLVRKYAEHRKLRRLLAGIKKIKDAGSLIIQVQETNAEAADPLIVGTKFDAKTIAWHNTLAQAFEYLLHRREQNRQQKQESKQERYQPPRSRKVYYYDGASQSFKTTLLQGREPEVIRFAESEIVEIRQRLQQFQEEFEVGGVKIIRLKKKICNGQHP